MSLRIRKIHIRNYRSARKLTIAPSRLAVLVGKNDSGKSNVLRALNLFLMEKQIMIMDLISISITTFLTNQIAVQKKFQLNWN